VKRRGGRRRPTPSLLADPYGAGWIFKIRIADASELDGLQNAMAYRAQIAK
jgi:glycine cleavage system H lipoate-binding protein